MLDFHHVSQVDTSAIKAFTKLPQLSEQDQFNICVMGASDEIVARLEQGGFFGESSGTSRIRFPQLEDGVSWCEQELLKMLNIGLYGRGISSELVDLVTLLTGDRARAETLAGYFIKQQVAAGESGL